ncbi:hypothetical protein CRG98_005356 [Punica granatum]|uniref:Uncharacterized protein n=1 Tax=Punica granatum TaxID=22663 RepID=A0A2I0L0I8_PUNGR|nr:hypothetical protein CRG98_005356 [Punica granatum]
MEAVGTLCKGCLESQEELRMMVDPPQALLSYVSAVACTSPIVVSVVTGLYPIFSSIALSLSLCLRLCGQSIMCV